MTATPSRRAQAEGDAAALREIPPKQRAIERLAGAAVLEGRP
jgi:hypothetical protein